MATRTKEEEKLLDEKIARIQKQNEEILRRRREIEEDKRMAEKHNAVVKLKPATTNISRERTPALKPSNRELQEDYPTRDFPEQSRGVRPNRGRGAELYRRTSEDSHKQTSGPPPDPKSFLYDEERDPVAKERENKPERRNNDEQWTPRGGGSDSREFSRFNRRGNLSGRRGGGRGRGGRNEEEEEWRAERKRVDEARIQRQRAADGRWRREWDNEKIEPQEESRYEQRPSPSSHPDHLHHHHHHPRHHQYEGEQPSSPEICRPIRSSGVTRGRGRGRLNPSELEISLDCLVEPPILPKKGSGGLTQRRLDTASPTSSSQDDLPMDPNRTVQCVGTNFKISIPNSTNTQSQPKPQRQTQGGRGRFRSQRNYSSQSDDDSPQDRIHGIRRHRQQRYQPGKQSQQGNSGYKPTVSVSHDESKHETSFSQNKPPLPPFRSDRPPSSAEPREDDESWEDITTSGNESMGDDHSSVNSSPEKKGIKSMVSVVNTAIFSQPINDGFREKELSCYPFDKYLAKSCSIDKNPDEALGPELKSTLNNFNDQTISGIIRIDSDKIEIHCSEIDLKQENNCAIEQENLCNSVSPSIENKEESLTDSCTTDQPSSETNVYILKEDERVLSDSCGEINIPKLHQVKQNISEGSEQNDDGPSLSTEEAETSGEINENVDLLDIYNNVEESKPKPEPQVIVTEDIENDLEETQNQV